MEKEHVLVYSKEKIFRALKEVLSKKDEIIFAYVHGSFLDGVLLNDIDIALFLDDKKIDCEETAYCERSSSELSERIHYTVDVHIMNRKPVGFLHSVFKHGKLVFSRDEELRSDLIERTSMAYMDFFELSMEYVRDLVYDEN